jgi:hypothetical protein
VTAIVRLFSKYTIALQKRAVPSEIIATACVVPRLPLWQKWSHACRQENLECS